VRRERVQPKGNRRNERPNVHNLFSTYLRNPWLRWYWEHGGEEIVGPHGPLVAQRAGPHPEPWQTATGPGVPWRVAVAQLVEAAQVQDVGRRLAEGHQRNALARSADAAISSILEDWCGTPPRKFPWPWPGPPPWVWEIAAELSHVANTLQAGSLRDGILDIAAQAVQKGSAQAS
jgi:hypothetical protein